MNTLSETTKCCTNCKNRHMPDSFCDKCCKNGINYAKYVFDPLSEDLQMPYERIRSIGPYIHIGIAKSSYEGVKEDA